MTERTWAEREALKLAKLIAEEIARRREETGEIIDPDDEELIASLEGATSTVELVNHLADRVRRNEAELDGLKVTAANYAQYMQAVIGKKTAQIENGKKRLMTILDMVGQSKIGRVSKRAPGGQRPVTWLVDEKDLPKMLPAPYWTVPEAPKPKPDKNAIRAALKHPEHAKELSGIATLGNGAPTLAID